MTWRPRLKLRTLIAIVAVAGIVCGCEVMRRRRSYCLDRAAFYDLLEQNLRIVARRYPEDLEELLKSHDDLVSRIEKFKFYENEQDLARIRERWGRDRRNTVSEWTARLAYVKAQVQWASQLKQQYRRVASLPFLALPSEIEEPKEPDFGAYR